MAYARVKCTVCGLYMEQNKSHRVEVEENSGYSVNDMSFGLSRRGNLRLWKQGNRTYVKNKSIFYCSDCYSNLAPSVEPETGWFSDQFKSFLKMLLLSLLYNAFIGGINGVTRLPRKR